MKKGNNNSGNNDDNTSVSNTTITLLNTTLQRVEKVMVSIISRGSDDNEYSSSHQKKLMIHIYLQAALEHSS